MKRFAAAALFTGEKVLLAKRTITRSNYPGIWDFIGGHCQADETFEEAVERELQEEIGVKPTEMVSLMVVDESPDFILNLFLVTKWDGDVSNKDDLEHERVEWLGLDEAKQLDFMNRYYLVALNLVGERS
jgi:8-oxo-dGTP diphosphatase